MKKESCQFATINAALLELLHQSKLRKLNERNDGQHVLLIAETASGDGFTLAFNQTGKAIAPKFSEIGTLLFLLGLRPSTQTSQRSRQ